MHSTSVYTSNLALSRLSHITLKEAPGENRHSCSFIFKNGRERTWRFICVRNNNSLLLFLEDEEGAKEEER
jgi:hypothetical protein